MLRKIFSFLGTRIGISLTLAILVIVGASLVKQKETANPIEKSPSAIAVEKIVKKSLEGDTDGDGLKNWEEALYKTDPEKTDTDGDGVSDGTEISTNRNPLVVGSGWEAGTTTSTGAQFNATDRFSQEIFIKYIEAKKSGKEITTEFSDQLAEEILSKDYSVSENVFDVSQLSLIAKPTSEEIHAYGNNFGKSISIPLPERIRDELTILYSIQTDGMTETDEAELTLLYERYSTIRNNLASIRVPSEIQNVHASFIRSIDTLRDTISGIQNLDTDPIGSFKKIVLFEDGLNNLTVASTALKTYFVKKGISFGSYEPGAPLLR
jgi:hypothetical protein